jgi:aspartate 1-decarboxylase
MPVRLHLFKAKIHRATVTHADLDYEGSVTISGDLMDAAGIVENEQVHVWNLTRGSRLVTYAVRGGDKSGVVCINGAAAHLCAIGDRVILATFADVEMNAAATWVPNVVQVDEHNRLLAVGRRELAGPSRRAAGLD